MTIVELLPASQKVDYSGPTQKIWTQKLSSAVKITHGSIFGRWFPWYHLPFLLLTPTSLKRLPGRYIAVCNSLLCPILQHCFQNYTNRYPLNTLHPVETISGCPEILKDAILTWCHSFFMPSKSRKRLIRYRLTAFANVCNVGYCKRGSEDHARLNKGTCGWLVRFFLQEQWMYPVVIQLPHGYVQCFIALPVT